MNRSFSAHELATIAMSVALIAVCSWISVPTTIPFTMQTFAVCLIAAVFGQRHGVWAVLCYILLGAVGAPVFAGFSGGFGVLLGTTGGYILGFLFTALIVGFASEKLGRCFPVLAAAMAAGVLVCYAFGTAWFIFVYTRQTGPVGLGAALGWCVFPYLLPDAVKVALASALCGRLYPILNREVRNA